MGVLYMSFGSKVNPRTFGCVAMGSAVLFILKSGLLLYSTQGLPNLIGRWLPTGQPSIAIWLPNNDWWLPNTARHKMLTFGG